MRFTVTFDKHVLTFKRPGGTSRGVLAEKPSWLISIRDEQGVEGIGECSIIPGLSPDINAGLESKIPQVVEYMNQAQALEVPEGLDAFPALRFAIETAILDHRGGGKKILFDNAFTRGEAGITINGLVWMGEPEFMWQQFREKVQGGFHCIKLKIGALNFAEEIELLRRARKAFGEKIEIRVDANGAFSAGEAPEVLKELHRLGIHSIEQPIKAGQWDAMARLCRETSVPIALDEELIGVTSPQGRVELLQVIKPQYIILKPSLIGGLQVSDEWISEAEKLNIGWWATSALESNIGLNAIAQWVGSKAIGMPQGLGTGSLFTNNIPMPLKIKGEMLWAGFNGL